MKKNVEWLKEETGELPCVDTVFNSDGSSYIDSAVPVMAVYDLLDQLDNQEVLSQEWIDGKKLRVSRRIPFHMDVEYAVPEDDLQNLLVPKQEEAYKDGYEKGKEHGFYKGYEKGKEHGFYKGYREGLGDKGGEPETVADVVTTFWKSYERLKEVMSMEVEELEE